MKAHTSEFKEIIPRLGRELDSIITYELNGETIELGGEVLNSIAPHYEGAILKSVMKQLDIDSNIDIPLGTELNYQFGVKTRNNEVEDYRDNYDYVNYGNYIVYSSEIQEDTKSYKITCYDKMLYAMKEYENSNITYPITIRNYISALCNKLGLTFKNASDEFANYDKEIPTELYLSNDGISLDYTFRDVFDELAEVTASTICINNDDELEIRYINDTNDTIDEEYLKDVNVNFGEKFGPVNTIILSRSADSDKVALSNPINLADEDKIAIQISDNQIMNDNNRADFMPDILNKLYGLEYYANDFSSTGICYLDLCDKYNIKIGDNIYSCIMFNDDVNITQGLEESIYTDMPEENETEYKYTSNDDRKVNQVYIMAKKNEGEIEAVVSRVGSIEGKEDNDYQELLRKFQSVDNAIIDIDEYKTITRQLQTDTYTKTEVQQIANGTGVNGVKVSAVITESGTFNEDGMTYEKTNAPTKSTINEIGLNVKNQNNSSVLFAGYVDENNAPQDLLNKYGDYTNQTIVGTDNIIVNNYLNIGTHSRIQNYGNGTGIFWR
jgi:hypothetical protein